MNLEELQKKYEELGKEIKVLKRKAEAEFPVFKRWMYTGEVVRFDDVHTATVVMCTLSGSNSIGYKYRPKSYSSPEWINIPYDKERGFYHGQPVECWDNCDTHLRVFRFYDAVNRCTFTSNGCLDGARWSNYKAVDHIHEWMREAYYTLEGV
jgi:hypothetical protein